MKTFNRFCAAACLALAAGCDGGQAYLVTQVPTDQSLKETVVQRDAGMFLPKIALVDVNGMLVNARGNALFGERENPVSLLAEKLEMARTDAQVKAVVLRINSPGGTVQATETMHSELLRFRKETGKPVIACITDVGASGAYQLACAGDRIICQPTSITGSIGVIVQTVSFAGTLKLIGVKTDAVISGPFKDMGSPLRDMKDKERELIQTMVDDFYKRFLEVVAQGRPKLSAEKIRELADGRVYTGVQAVELGLVDQLGDLQDAVAEAKKAAGVTNAKVVMYDRPLGYRANVYSSASVPPAGTQFNLVNIQSDETLLLRRPTFLYLWTTDACGMRN